MTTREDTREDVRTTVTVIGAFCAVISLGVLAAWLGGGSFAEAVADRMKANSAFSFTLLGAALCLRAHRRNPKLADALALLPAVIGLITLLQYVAGVDLGIDELLQREHSVAGEAARFPNRMAPNTAFSLFCLGLAVFAASRGRTAALLSQGLGVVTFFTGFTAIVGYLYDAAVLFQPTPYIRMAGLTATLAAAAGFATVFLRSELGLSRTFTRDDAGGYVLRRTIPVVIGLPVGVGWLRLLLQSTGVVDTPTGTALLVVFLTAISGVMAVLLGRSVSVADEQRRASEQSLEAIAKLNSGLARARDVDDVLRVVVSEGADVVGAKAISVFLLNAEGTSLDVRGSQGYATEALASFRSVRIDAHTPACDAWRTQAPVLVENREALLARYPLISPEHVRYPALAALPMLGREGALGVLGVSFAQPRSLTPRDVEQLSMLAWHCAQTLERAMLLDSERRLRAAAEANMAELRAAQEAAVAANQTKDEFLAMLGHELRNPLAPIVIALDVLDRKKETALLRERRIIDRQVKHLMRMVDDLLDVSRIARGKIVLNRTRIELHLVVMKAVEMAAPLFEQKRHQLLIDVPEQG
ncbi:MAG: HAMP domain-containing histidine kinase, partial [Myxococcaceae bacterium]|nr:HAMP domain-containing histidine kinase [Myxococcaceae bacterium]